MNRFSMARLSEGRSFPALLLDRLGKDKISSEIFTEHRDPIKMLVKINELREREQPLSVETDFTDQDLKIRSRVCVLEKPVHSRMTVSLRSGNQVCIGGSLQAELKLTCSRCLKHFSSSINKGFELEYWPDPEASGEGEEFELTYPDLVVGFYRDQQVDLSAMVSEQIVLEIPMKPVCSEACKGLCDQCGRDLNKGLCDCQPPSEDPRWALLADMKKRLTH